MIKTYLFAIFVFVLSFITLYAAGNTEVKWFKAGITIIFSAMVSMLVTFNIFR